MANILEDTKTDLLEMLDTLRNNEVITSSEYNTIEERINEGVEE